MAENSRSLSFIFCFGFRPTLTLKQGHTFQLNWEVDLAPTRHGLEFIFQSRKKYNIHIATYTIIKTIKKTTNKQHLSKYKAHDSNDRHKLRFKDPEYHYVYTLLST